MGYSPRSDTVSTSRSAASNASARKPPRDENPLEPRLASQPAEHRLGRKRVRMEAELKSQLNEDLKQALRTGDKLRLSVIRAVLAAIEKAESDRQKKLVDDAAARGASAAARGSSILSDGKLDENA